MSVRIEKITARQALLTERVTKDQAELAELAAELQSLEALANVKDGDVVYFAVGRAETRAVIGGRVIAVDETDEKGKKLRVFAGEGINANCYTLTPAQVLSVNEPPKQPEAPAVEQEEGQAAE